MADELTATEARLIETNRRLRAQLDEVTSENDGLQLRCEKQQLTIDGLTAEKHRRGQESSDSSFALVVRSDSDGSEPSGRNANDESAASATLPASTEARFRDIAEILTAHDRRMSQLETSRSTAPGLDQAAVEAVVQESLQALERRLTAIETRPATSTAHAPHDNREEHAKEHKKILRIIDQLRTFMRRAEAREKHEREIDMADSRERLLELWEVLGRNENDGQVRRAGPFEGTADEFALLRDRVLCRLAGLAAYDHAFFEAKAAALVAKGKAAAV